jgi:tagaturonate reductase
MELSKQKVLKKLIHTDHVQMPQSNVFDLPEKVIQFGTGVLLRGLPDYFIDKANKQGIFNGRMVVIKSTNTGSTDSFNKQDNLYTLCIKGIEDGEKVDENIINASISRVLNAHDEWGEILACAANPDLQLVISNTTEVGIVLTDDNIHNNPPSSFPGKLLAFLYERYRVFQGDASKGLAIIPAELVPDNGKMLSEILMKLSEMNKLEDTFKSWLTAHNYICSSLVDRIVPGKLPEDEHKAIEGKLGYEDALMIMAEPYRLWAIESSSGRVREILSFSKVDDGVIIADNIDKHRELKMRLLNGTHTFSCGPALLSGIDTVKEAMSDEIMGRFIEQIMEKEIVPAITDAEISLDEAMAFSQKVLDRFRNPFIEHHWLSITAQYSSKMKMRNIPILLSHYKKNQEAPSYMAFSFAAYIYFMKVEKTGDTFEARLNEHVYAVKDSKAGILYEHWKKKFVPDVVLSVLQDKMLWDIDLTEFPGFSQAVTEYLQEIIESTCAGAMNHLLKEQHNMVQ